MKNLQSLFSLSLLSIFAFVASLGLSHSALAMSQEERQLAFQEAEAREELLAVNSLNNFRPPYKPSTNVRQESFNLPAGAFDMPVYKTRPKKSWFGCCSASTVQE
jgi:hypothetical protein